MYPFSRYRPGMFEMPTASDGEQFEVVSGRGNRTKLRSTMTGASFNTPPRRRPQTLGDLIQRERDIQEMLIND